MDEGNATPPRVIDRLNDRGSFTKRELLVAKALASNYPAAGLETIASLATAAGVSSPTVLRFVRALGFTGFGQLQKALRSEIPAEDFEGARMPESRGPEVSTDWRAGEAESHSGPLSKLSARAVGESSTLPGFTRAITQRVTELFTAIPVRVLEETVGILADTGTRILTVGGRFSSTLADYLEQNLALVRPKVETINDPFGASAARLMDFGGDDTLVIFDFPRYQRDSIELAQRAAARNACIIAITDSHEAPICEWATLTIIVPTDGPTPLDSYAAAVLLIEYLVARVFEVRGDSAIERIRLWNDVGRGRMVE